MSSGSFWNPNRNAPAPVPPAYSAPPGVTNVGAPTNPCLDNTQVASVSTVAGQSVLIAKCSSGRMRIIYISCQPDADCHLQLFEGTGKSKPLSALRKVGQDLLWSWPGKNVFDDVYLFSGEGSVNVQVESRTIGA